MNVAGIIAEYNPFHKGHAYHIRRVRQEANASYIIALISGNFVQRGAPACADKYVRARMALSGGADLVLELPVCAAVSSAETFARCGVSIFAHTGVVTHLGFGCESDSPAQLSALADLFAEEPAAFRNLLFEELKKGRSFPSARASAARKFFKNDAITSVLESPNNILAIEYLKAIRQLHAPLTPCMILRKGSSYHSMELTTTYSSASAIRGMIQSDIQQAMPSIHCFDRLHKDLNDQIPETSLLPFINWLEAYGPVVPDDFSLLLHYKLLQDFSFRSDNTFSALPYRKDPSAQFYPETDQTDSANGSELDNRTRKLLENYTSFSSFTELLKTKDRTYTAISRYLLSHLLNIDNRTQQALQQLDHAPYLRVLGMKREASPLLKAIRQHSDIPILTRLAAEEKNLNPTQQLLLHTDIQATHIYNSVLTSKTGKSVKNE